MTQQYTQKYTVVCFLQPQKKSSNFSASAWPLHVTMLDTFKTGWQLHTLSEALEDIARNTTSFDTVSTQKALLGEEKDVPVKLLSLGGGMSALHRKLMGVAAQGSFVFNTPEFVGDGFLPHITDQHDGKVAIGQKYRLSSISLVDMFPDDDHTRREVIDTFNLFR